jgi:hypothetical protein
MEGSDLERMRGRRSLRRKPTTVEKGGSRRKFFWTERKEKMETEDRQAGA